MSGAETAGARRHEDAAGADGAPGKPRRSASLTDRAYADIEELIVTLVLAPGSAISEPELTARLGIGRTPIREALQRLAREKLVRVLPRRGILVSAIDVAAQLRLLDVRRELERLIAKSAARRATDDERALFRGLAAAFEQAAKANDDTTFLRIDRDFNQLCSLASHNEFAAGAMSLMHSLSRRFWYLHYKQAADMPRTAKLHADIARAIAAGNEEGAAKASDKLLDVIAKFTRNTVSP
ncbi:MAG: GntR family transcriptional regulator [Pseudomonadota bacterium]|nr:GntR family transcriptional regulator [Pseudomonadota bacterium]